MAEYIEREALEKTMNERLTYLLDKNGPYDYFTDGYDEAVSTVEEFLSADVAPVVHGRWDNIPNTYMLVARKDGSYSGNATTCSVCHEVNPNAYKTNYCPNCGAKMDGGDPE